MIKNLTKKTRQLTFLNNIENIFILHKEKTPFNQGMLFNSGFKEAQLVQEKFQCFIFHDVDLLREYNGNPYTCPEDGRPRQMAFSVDSWNYK
jgi:hypothetical protein